MESSFADILFFSDAPDDSSAINLSMRVVPLNHSLEERVEIAVVDGRVSSEHALACCRIIKAKFPSASVSFVATNPSHRIAALRCGADASLPNLDGDEFPALLSSQLRRKELSASLRRKAEDADNLSRQLQQAYGQIKLDLAMAGRLQNSFLPKSLPQIGNVRFASHYRPSGPVGGDFFDVIRLDEHHIGFYVADVMGHGIPAALLTIYLKRAVTTKDISPTGYRIVPPHEVLGRLNREIIGAEIAEQPFATMVYGIVNIDTGKITLSRAAHPYPIIIGADGSVAAWEIPGKMLGVFETDFRSESRQLAPRDKLLLSTDGALPDSRFDKPSDDSELFKVMQLQAKAPIKEFIAYLASQFISDGERKDDATLLALEFRPT